MASESGLGPTEERPEEQDEVIPGLSGLGMVASEGERAQNKQARRKERAGSREEELRRLAITAPPSPIMEYGDRHPNNSGGGCPAPLHKAQLEILFIYLLLVLYTAPSPVGLGAVHIL
uniref:Uncharacterized protein n=1 Tax=Micrurus spixii TaxID=129469 RepID=A0A2D4MRQ7_9SAUR